LYILIIRLDTAIGFLICLLDILTYHFSFLSIETCQKGWLNSIRQTRLTIIAMEQGKYSPSLELAFRIALAFGVPLEEVFSYDVEDETTK